MNLIYTKVSPAGIVSRTLFFSESKERRIHKKTALQSPSLDLYSQILANQVLSALTRFTSEFGKGSGGTTSLKRLEDSKAVSEQLLFRFLEKKHTVNYPVKRDIFRDLHINFVNDITHSQVIAP